MRPHKILSLSISLLVFAAIPVLFTTSRVGAHSSPLSASAAPGAPVSFVKATPTLKATFANTLVPAENLHPKAANSEHSADQHHDRDEGGTPNSPTNPLFVRDVDNPANEPFQGLVCFSFGPLYPCNGNPNTLTVPTTHDNLAVKALVIDYVSGICGAYVGADVVNVSLVIPQGVLGNYFIPVKTYVDPTNVISYVFTQETRLYVGPGQTIAFGYTYETLGPTVSNYCFATIVGHYVLQ